MDFDEILRYDLILVMLQIQGGLLTFDLHNVSEHKTALSP